MFIVAGLVGVAVAVAPHRRHRPGHRRRKADDDDPVQIEGNFKAEIGWTIAPAVLLAVIAVPTVATLLKLDDAGAVEADVAAMEITVYGQQWWWSFEYDLDGDGEVEIITANELVIPAGDRHHGEHRVPRRRSTRSGSRRSTAPATPCPAARTRWCCRPTSPVSSTASARSSAACRTPT